MSRILFILFALGCNDAVDICECAPDLAIGQCSRSSDCRPGMYCVDRFGGCHEPGFDGGAGPCSEIFTTSCQRSLTFDPGLDCRVEGELVECTCKYGHC